MQRIVERERGGKSTMLELNDADVILSIREWAALVGIGYSSARKMLREGNGPKKTALSMHRIGIAISSHKEWIRERTG
jgi:predicted DNA-binding transcriptional regulator AlpA